MKLPRLIRILALTSLLAPGGLLAEETSKAPPAAAPANRIADVHLL